MELYAGKKILVTGGTGMIGRALVAALLRAGGDVHIASLDDPSRALPGTTFHRLDLMRNEEPTFIEARLLKPVGCRIVEEPGKII